MNTWLLTLALLASPAWAAGDDAGEEAEATGPRIEKVSGAPPEEVASFQKLRDRFQARVQELEDDTRAWVERQREVQLERLADGYDPYIAELEERERLQRGEAIAQMETFLRRWDGVPYASEVRLRLAELHFQEAEEEWLTATDAFVQAYEEAGDDLDLLAELEEQGEPKIELSRVTRLLERIIDDNRDLPADEQYPLLDVAYYMLAFCYGEPASTVWDDDLARGTFRSLIRARPNSEYADSAHLLLGNYAFGENDYRGSIPEFEAVIARGPEQKYYMAGLYQLAWARYKLSEYDDAIAIFVQLLDLSKEKLRDTGRASDYEPDSVAYLALSLSDQADEAGQTPLERAQTFFGGLGESKSYSWDVYKELAESLVRYARPLDAVEIYQHLQTHPEYRLRPENPEFQSEVVRLLSRGYDADLAAAGEARLKMTERYGEGSEWWIANRNNPDALAKARGFIESSLVEVAVEVKFRAQESGDPATYSLAADKYREYLDKFPIADDYFDNQFQLADALYNAGRYTEAVEEYQSLVDNKGLHKYGDASVYLLMQTRERLLRDTVGALDRRFEGAGVERTYTTPGGEEMTVYALVPEQSDFLAAADGVLAHEFGEPVDGLDLRAILEENRPKILYLTAQMLYFANRYDEARPRLRQVFESAPETIEASYAAKLFLNTYILEKDNEQVRTWARVFTTTPLGPPSDDNVDEEFYGSVLEKSVYGEAAAAAKSGDYAAAAEGYLAFVEQFPNSQNVPDALLSAAANMKRQGRAKDAIQLYERFLGEFPDHPDAQNFYFPIADNYESTFDLASAIRYYEELVRRYPEHVDAPIALYQVAFLKVGLGDNLGAAEAYERYANEYPEQSDREAIHFEAGAQYELADRGKAVKFYQRYLRTYGTQNPNRAIEAQHRLSVLYEAQGRKRDASKALDAVVKLFDDIIAEGGAVGPRGRDLAAAAAFREIREAYDDFTARKWTGDGEKDADLIVKVVPEDFKVFDKVVIDFVQKYLSFEYTTAAIYLQGAHRSWYAENGLAIEPPSNLSMDDTDAYWALLEENLFPLMYAKEAEAETLFKQVLELAATQKRHSEWVDASAAALNELKPSDYPAVKDPIVIDAVGSARPRLKPLSPPAPEPEEGQ